MLQGYTTSIISVQVKGQQKPGAYSKKKFLLSPIPEREADAESSPVRMMIDIRITNGMRIQQHNLTYQN